MTVRSFIIRAAVLLWVGAAARPLAAQERPPLTAVTPAGRDSLLTSVTATLEREYVRPGQVRGLAQALRRRAGAYPLHDPAALADSVTADLQRHLGNAHVELAFVPGGVRAGERPGEEFIRQQQALYRFHNFGFYRVERMGGNVGYLDLRVFADPAWDDGAARSAMEFLRRTDGLIIDLRENGGGEPAMAALLASFLLDDQPVPFSEVRYRNGTVERSATDPALWPRRYGSQKPIIILTSGETFSAAEAFARTLQRLGRATVLGDTTRGGGTPATTYPVGSHFRLSVPDGMPVDPATGGELGARGVAPDVVAPAADALGAAHRLVLERLLTSAPDDTLRRRYRQALDELAAR